MASAPPLPDLDFEAMSAEDVLRWAHSEFGDRMCLTCSWQRQSSVLVHMVSELGLEIPVVELRVKGAPIVYAAPRISGGAESFLRPLTVSIVEYFWPLDCVHSICVRCPGVW